MTVGGTRKQPAGLVSPKLSRILLEKGAVSAPPAWIKKFEPIVTQDPLTIRKYLDHSVLKLSLERRVGRNFKFQNGVVPKRKDFSKCLISRVLEVGQMLESRHFMLPVEVVEALPNDTANTSRKLLR
ncbi:hypothetical protein AVEN_227181-1 [Araneus ventricosus]|uniref:Uncharacterized protein n=1 Tax=Araneus ventricosus TaxID=182803 RepID=A0A4Y2BWX1_ARAVE|nr:hypothetical protein AVEN_227181-1 [Araneus ventricosus]